MENYRKVKNITVEFDDGIKWKTHSPEKAQMMKQILWHVEDVQSEINFQTVEKIVNFAYELFTDADDSFVIAPSLLATFVWDKWDEIEEYSLDNEGLLDSFIDIYNPYQK
jgi:hypothetical protein